jgi:hypothetical protein
LGQSSLTTISLFGVLSLEGRIHVALPAGFHQAQAEAYPIFGDFLDEIRCNRLPNRAVYNSDRACGFADFGPNPAKRTTKEGLRMPSKAALESVHDAFIIPSNGKLHHFKASMADNNLGEYDSPPEVLERQHTAFRRTMNIARLGDEENPRGPALAVLPRKPDPATSQICCYLVNSENIRAANAWTIPAWNSEPSEEDGSLSARQQEQTWPLELLVADASPQVLRVTLTQDGGGIEAAVTRVDLSLEGELFNQLRCGLVAGRVRLSSGDELPVVNAASLV